MNGKSIAALSIGAVFLALLGVWVWGAPDPSPATEDSGVVATEVDFEPFVLDADAVRPQWDRERAADLEMDGASTALIDALHRHNYAKGVGARGLFEGDASLLEADYQARLHAWADMRTMDDYMAFSWVAYEDFEKGLTELLRFANLTDTPLPALLDDPLVTQVHAYYEGCGDFLDAAMQLGIVGEDGTLQVTPELIVIFFRHMWAHEAREIWPVDQMIPGTEARAMLRWRIEDGGLPLDRRLALIERLDREHMYGGYPTSFARAIAYYDAGDVGLARAQMAMASAAAPDDAWVQSVASLMAAQ